MDKRMDKRIGRRIIGRCINLRSSGSNGSSIGLKGGGIMI
jgi:hypothetical protein